MAARTIHDNVNDLVKRTILKIEKILRRLPQKGDRVDVITASARDRYNQADSVRENRNASVLLIDQESSNSPSTSNYSQTVRLNDKPRHMHKATGHILSDSVRVTPLNNMEGMVINMLLCLKKERSYSTQLIDICIECPDFRAHRICVDGRWYNIE
ncbi:hypothetical protein RB195_016521 [Necator americanus]|uniref:Uncharacterized protein n=1 Tax=Necator americanus TaxID=51031 RepID=A0ABR1C0U9_NECAM